MKSKVLVLIILCSVVITGCKKKGCMDPSATNYNPEAEKDNGSCEYYTVPTDYIFYDGIGNNTVSFSGQTARMNMLSEMTTYLKSANNGGAQLDETTLLTMYDNSYTGWMDQTLVDNGKQLKNKTALNDAAIWGQFEAWMTEAASASPPVDGYLQAASGHEWTQLIEKGLMSACFASQMTANYLDGIMEDDNVQIVDYQNDKFYTEMEHHWDEAYGYFTDATDYPTNGTNRFWGKYANNTLESLLQSGSRISEAFRTGRAAISAGILIDVPEQVSIIQAEVKRMVAGMAIHYLNATKQKVVDGESQNTVNHYLSEAWAFIYGIPFCKNPDMTYATVEGLLGQIDADFEGFSQSTVLINAMIDDIAAASGLEAYKNDL
jgi:hypothetical protein